MYRSFLDSEAFELTVTELGTDTDRVLWLGGERDEVRADVTMSIEEAANDAAGNLIDETTISFGWISNG